MSASHLASDLARSARKRHGVAPKVFHLARAGDRARVAALLAERAVARVVDDFPAQLEELFQVEHPTLAYQPEFAKECRRYVRALAREAPLEERGRWVYYPWSATLVHVLERGQFEAVRAARNKNLINAEEQARYADAVVGIAGLSVGASIALALALSGGARRMRFADMDRLALSNTNRIPVGIADLGAAKVAMAARLVYEINPYAEIELFPEGLSKRNIKRFFAGPPRLTAAVDEIDTLAVKRLIREEARRAKTPVLSAADCGDGGIFDVERCDQDPPPAPFHGRLKADPAAVASLDKFSLARAIVGYLGPENQPLRMQESLGEIGKTLVSWPQLGSAALMNGAAVAYAVRRIANGQPLFADRAVYFLDEKLAPDYFSPRETAERARKVRDFAKAMGLPAPASG